MSRSSTPHARAHGRRPRLLAAVAAAALLAGCAGGDDEAATPDGTGSEATSGDADGDGDAADGQDTGDDTGEDADDAPAADDGEGDADAGGEGSAVASLAGEPTTEPVSSPAENGRLTVTDVRVAGHDGFDRVVLELAGEGTPGWNVRYAPDGQAHAQGSGQEIDVAGEAALEVAVHGIVLPPDRPDDVEGWDGGRLPGPEQGVVTEVVEDTIFEGIHTFVVGTTGEHGYVVERLTDPDRLVLDVHHDG